MLIDLLSPLPGASPVSSSSDRLFTGNYKSQGNLVSFKVDIIDFTDFQRQGCLIASGCSEAGPGLPHSHNITGTLVCQPDSNTARLNISLVPATSSASKFWAPASPDTTAKEAPKAWPPQGPLPQPHLNKAAMSGYPGPAPDSLPVPPLLDFHPDQLMNDIHNITFDIKEQLPQLPTLPQLPPQLYTDPPPNIISHPSSIVSTASSLGSNPLLSQQLHQSQPSASTTFVLSQHGDKCGGHGPGVTHPTLLQPKLERSDSICSDFNPGPLKEEFLSYSDDLAGLDDLDTDSISPPTSISSPLLFSPPHHNRPPPILSQHEKNAIFFNKSFEPTNSTNKLKVECCLPVTSPGFPVFPSPVSGPPSSTCLTLTNNTSLNTVTGETRKPFTLSHNDSPKSFSSSPVSSPHDTPITLLTSPKSRNRRNSSFDETKPHVCPQCGARFTTKSNLGQHAKIHLAVKPFICEICNHGFTRAAHYESHVAKHKGLKTHRCDQCGESFARLDNLLRHSARHKHGKIFDCSTCGKGFHRKDKLLEHEKVHSEYSFPCPKCSKTFHTNDALKHHLPLHEDSSKAQCKICLKFINCKSLSKHMSAFHKDSVTSLENNNNIPSGSKSSKSSRSRNNNSSAEKVHPCQYCKKAFVSPAKLRLHTAKFHAEERLNEVQPQPQSDLSGGSLLEAGPGGQDPVKLKFYEDGPGPRYHSPSSGSDGMPSQQVPEMELSYVNSSPEDISEFGGGKAAELPSMGGNTYSSIPTIHIPEFDNIQSKMGDNGEISNEAIQALLFS